MRAILHNIRSIYNVASIFRTADGVGLEKLYLSGYTPTPKDRFGRDRNKFKKVALGAENSVDWIAVDDIHDLIKDLQSQNVQVFACEPKKKALDYRKISIKKEPCFVFGNEPDGLPDKIVTACDQVVQIPMKGKKTSLNVSVAFGVITYSFDD